MIKPAKPVAYRLLHDGCIALAQVEANGLKVDVDYLEKTIKDTDRRIAVGTERLKASSVYTIWRKEFGSKATLGSREQLAHVVFDVMGYKCPSYTTSGRPKADEESFVDVDEPFVRNYIKLEKLKKVRTTYLGGIRRELTDGFIHPVYNLHIARTYRGSSDSPNFQNFPIRDPATGKLIRSCFIPREEDRVLVEIDFSGIEVRIAACYHKDPTMLSYIKDPTKDMHRDMAAECFLCKPEQVSKNMRYCAKNMYVFPEFYGSYYMQCAPNLWAAMEAMDLTIEDESVREYLRTRGITSLGSLNPKDPARPGTYIHHMKKVEDHFWNERFARYAKWKKKWYSDYQHNGGFDTLTGFRIEGLFSRNDVINYPIQGSAFHCLLWSLIQLNNELSLQQMRAVIVGQIHDSIVADVPLNELQYFIALAKEIMTERLLDHWKWINVPIDVEVEAAPVGASWHEKTLYQESNYDFS